jgi:thiol-disulfide isomerase/thioredoxin
MSGDAEMRERIARGILIVALLAPGCDSGLRPGAPNGGRGADNPTGVPAGTPGGTTPPAQPQEPTSADTDPPEQPRETLPVDPQAAAPAAATSADGQVQLIALSWEGIQEQIAARKGKVVVVDLWATYCLPCRETFPGLVELSILDPEKIACISVSLDDAEDEEKRAEALAFLQEQQAKFPNYLCTTDADTLYDEILKIGGIPAVYVYGKDGQLAKLFNGPTPEGTEHTYEEHITPYVLELAEAP